jgi:hypothetical protein
MALITCPECKHHPVSDQASACPKCGFPIKKPEYTFIYVDANSGSGYENVMRLTREGWQVVDEHEEAGHVVYKLIR